MDGERFERPESCLAALPEKMRRVVVLRKVDGLSGRAAAEVLARSEEATRKLYSRAMARLGLLVRGGDAR